MRGDELTQHDVPRFRRFALPNGVQLAADVWGPPSGFPVLMFHGGGQTRSSWASTGRVLAMDGWQAVCVDLRGHGESDWPEDGDYRLDAFVDDVRLLTRCFEPRPFLVGASLGGQAVLAAAGESEKPLATAVVLVDIATRMESEGFERIVGFMNRHQNGFASLEEAVDAISEYRGRPRPKDLSGLSRNLRVTPDGRFRWHWDPRFLDSNRTADSTAYEKRLEDAARVLRVPALLVRGAISDLLSEEGARRFLDLARHARFVDVSNAGHMVVGDSNDSFSEAVRAFLASHASRGLNAS